MPTPHPPTRALCGAKAKRTGQPCRGWAMKNGRCRLHGGKSLAGLAAPNFRTGARSRYLGKLPGALAPHFHPSDPDRVSLGDEISLLDAGIGELLQRMKRQHGVDRWPEAQAAFQTFERARAAKRVQAMTEALTGLGALLAQGAAAEQSRAQIWDLIDRRVRAVAVESRRLRDQHEMVERSEFARFLKVFLLSMREHLSALALDPVVLRATMMRMQEDALRILTVSQGPIAEAEDEPAIH